MSYLFGVSKSTIHNWFYMIGNLKDMILNSIVIWSGVICVDEKWIKIKGKWFYVLSAVDNATGFPLFFMLATDLKAETWNLFFTGFKRIYGKPKLIISDGSTSLALGMRRVFPKVRHQLCKFHKLKNLFKVINLNISDDKENERVKKLAKNMFRNTTLSSRKKALKTIVSLGHKTVNKYIELHIAGDWKKLTGSFTSNAVERWNRKLEKLFSGRYGLKSIEFVNQLLAALWLVEAIKNKKNHLTECFIYKLNIRRICQEKLKLSNIISFVRHNLLEKVA